MEDPIASTSAVALAAAAAAPEDASGEADKEPVRQNEGAEWPVALAPAAAANRVAVTEQELAAMDANAIRKIWTEQDRYVDQLETKCREAEAAATAAVTSGDLQQQQQQKRQDVSRREHLLVMRLSTKEQELQELSAQIGELKSAQVPTASQLRATLVDPGVNIIIQKLKASLPKLLLTQTLK